MSVGRRRFRIIKEIAEGGFGKVYLAEQLSSDAFSRIVAIKLLHAKWSSHDEVVKRTRDEARVLGRIRHQHIVKVEDLTSIEGKCAIVMEYLEGVDLKWMSSFLKERNQEFSRAALFEIILAVASALDAAYSSVPLQSDQPLRAIHRDIKPSNIFVTVAGGVKVLDFGTARANFAEREAKTQALAFGSQGYMAPERMLGEEDTPAADVFSLGITLFELLTLDTFGRIPPRPNKFSKKIEEKVALVPLKGEPEWCNQVRDTLRLMLSYAPTDRPSAAQLVEIMDLLAQEAGDTGLRRYCRTLVSEAKDALPVLETDDPLIGKTVDEDEFSGFTGITPDPAATSAARQPALATMNSAAPRSQAPAGTPAPPGRTGAVVAPQPAPTQTTSNAPAVSDQLPPPPAPSAPAVRTVNPAPVRGDDPVTNPNAIRISAERPPTPRPSGGGGLRAMGALAVGLVVLGVGGAAIAGVILVAAVVFGWSGSAVTPPPEPAPVPAPVVPDPVAGGRITAPDTRPDAEKKAVPTVLTFSDAAGGQVELVGPSGFKATWDGKAPFDLGAAGEGEYKSNVKAGERSFRLKRFVVEAGKADCAFVFDVAKGDWQGACK